jgi:hypothetical protein
LDRSREFLPQIQPDEQYGDQWFAVCAVYHYEAAIQAFAYRNGSILKVAIAPTSGAGARQRP